LDKPGPLPDRRFFDQSVVSPLRYPGAKRQLTTVIESLIRANVPPPRLFVEPFCGGATAALHMAGRDVVDHVILADADPLVAAFWYAAAFDTSWLISAMHAEEITLDRWDWWRLADPKRRRDKAMKCLFLNRTTFSGILHGRAGPIGGRAQTSPYKIDCRFGKEGLERRLRAVGNLAATGRILDVWNLDWRDTFTRLRRGFGQLEADEIAVYLDPPYVEKAPFLYEWSFESAEHQALARALADATRFRWVLSYDDNDTIRALYAGAPDTSRLAIPYRYTAAGSEKRSERSELLVTNYADLPPSMHCQLV
jgi:DNA adenine methylase